MLDLQERWWCFVIVCERLKKSTKSCDDGPKEVRRRRLHVLSELVSKI